MMQDGTFTKRRELKRESPEVLNLEKVKRTSEQIRLAVSDHK
jgi:hypothetical protein